MYKELSNKLKKIKLRRQTILIIIASIGVVYLFVFLEQKVSCERGTYKYTDLNGKEGYANTCLHDNNALVCTRGKLTVVVNSYKKNKGCN